MAIITEEEEGQQEEPKHPQNKPTKPQTPETQKPSSSSATTTSTNPFAFWFYFTLTVSLTTLLFASFNSLSSQDPKSWFLSLPTSLRQHYSKGRTIKVQTRPDQSPIEVFTFDHGPAMSENVVFVHGLGLSSYSFREIVRSLGAKGVLAVAIDLPGNGFSDKSVMEIGRRSNGVLGRFWDVYSEIQANGLFWAFDQMVETGQIPYEEIEARKSKRKVSKPVELDSEEVGKVLGQVIETMGLSPVHLVLHDSALGMSANWVLENSKSVRSVTLLDPAPRSVPALHLWALEMPVIREFVLGFSFVYAWLIKKCCSRGIGSSDLEAHRVLLNSRDARRALVGMGKKLNYSFDIAEWGGSDELKGVPLQVIWSKSWSKEWSEEGERVAEALVQASFVAHSGGRWPQDSADQVAQSIFQFVSALPATVREVVEERVPEHIQRMLDEAKINEHHHHHGHGGHDHHHGSHGHAHEAGFMDAYGLGHGHGHGHGW